MTESITPHQAVTLDELYASLEALRERLVDLEAMASAAARTIEELPYRPERADPDGKSELTAEHRRKEGRMQSLVFSTADAARVVLDEIEKVLSRFRCVAEHDER